MNWIEITEELPPIMETVILAYNGGVTTGWLESIPDEDPVYYSPEIRGDLENITHWMPLPNHPVDPRLRLNNV